MATISERLQYVLQFDTRQAVSALNQVGKAGEAALDDNKSRLDRAAGGMVKYGAAAMATAGVAGMAMFSLAKSASQVEESTNAVNVTFGEQAQAVFKLGQTSSKSMGLSTSAFNQAAVGFSSFAQKVAGEGGNVAKTTTDMMQRASDFASVMNMDVNQAMAVFRSAMAGETESIKRFGIDMSAASVEAYALANGIVTSTKNMTESEKVVARYGLLMQSTEQMAGDFQNTSDSLANSQRILAADVENLKANIGAGLVPVFGVLVSAATDVTGAFNSLGPEMQKTIGTAAGLGVAALGSAGALSFLIGIALKAKENFRAVSEGFSAMSLGAQRATLALGAIGLVLAGAAALYIGYKKHQMAVEEQASKLADAIRTQLDALVQERDLLEELSTVQGRAAVNKEVYTKAVEESGAVTEDQLETLGRYGTNLDKIYDLTLQGVGAVEADIAARLRSTGAFDENADAIARSVVASNDLGKEELKTLGATDAIIDIVLAERDAYRALNTEMGAGTRAYLEHTAGLGEAEAQLVANAVAAVRSAEGLKTLSIETATNNQLMMVALEVARMQEEGYVAVAGAVDRSANRIAAHGGAVEQSTEATEESTAAWEEWGDTLMAEAEAAQDKYDEMTQAALDWADDVRSAVNAGAAAHVDFSAKQGESAAEYVARLDAEIAATRFWEGALANMIGNSTAYTEDEKGRLLQIFSDMQTGGDALLTELAGLPPEVQQQVFDKMLEGSALTSDGMLGAFDPVAGGINKRMTAAQRQLGIALANIKYDAAVKSKEIGTTIPDGVRQGVQDGQGALNAQVKTMIQGALAAARAESESKSPSQLFKREVGAPIVQGIEQGIVEEGDKIAKALESAIESAEKDAVKAAEDLVDAASDALSGLWGGIGDQRSEEDLRERVADATQSVADAEENLAKVREDPESTARDIADAEEKVRDARESLEDANYSLARSTEYMLGMDAAARESWIATATAAGLTRGQIDALVAAYDALTEAIKRSREAREAASDEAERFQRIRADFAVAVRSGLVSKDALTHIGSLSDDPAGQVWSMAVLLNNIQRFFGWEVKQYAKGGTVPGSGPQLAVVHGGETITPANGMDSSDRPIVLIIEGTPFRAILADHENRQVAELMAGLR